MTPIKDLKFTSLNVRGVAKLIKLKQVINRLKQQNPLLFLFKRPIYSKTNY